MQNVLAFYLELSTESISGVEETPPMGAQWLVEEAGGPIKKGSYN